MTDHLSTDEMRKRHNQRFIVPGRRRADVIAANAIHFINLGMKVLGVVAAAFVTGIGLLVSSKSVWEAFIKGLL